MEKKILVGLLVITCCILSITPFCFAETYYQKNGLFKIDVPDGWHWTENEGKAIFKDLDGKIRIVIGSESVGAHSVLERKAALELTKQSLIKQMKESLKATVLGEKKSQLDGVDAIQIDFLMPGKGGSSDYYCSYIACLNKGYSIVMGLFSGLKEEEKEQVEKIVETFQFQ